MKIFISWSGKLSHDIALALHDWLPQIINALEPYVSSKDIKAGEQWFSNVRQELASSSHGIICLTKENLKQPWVLFEAGALSTSMTRARVVPFLIDISPSDLYPPLSEFQAVTRNKKDVLHLLHSLYKELDIQQLKEAQLEKAFQVWWEELDQKIEKAINECRQPSDQKTLNTKTPEKQKSGKERQILEEVLNNTRALIQLMEEAKISIDAKESLDNYSPEPKHIREGHTQRKNESGPSFMKGTFKKVERKAIDLLKSGKDPDNVYKILVSSGIPSSEAEDFVKEYQPLRQ